MRLDRLLSELVGREQRPKLCGLAGACKELRDIVSGRMKEHGVGEQNICMIRGKARQGA